MSDVRRYRILYATAEYLPHTGGTPIHTHQVAQRLAAAGHDVTVLATDRHGDLPPREEIEGVSVRRVPAWPASRDYYFAPAVYGAVRDTGAEILHCQGYHTLFAPLAMDAARRADVPYVLTFHSGGHSSVLRKRLRPLQWRALRPLLARASQLIGVSAFEADLFRNTLSLPESLFEVVPNGVDPTIPTQVGEVTPDPHLIVTFGRLERYKGHHRVLEALPYVLPSRPEARVLVLGSGPYERNLRTLARRLGIQDQVSFRAVPGAERVKVARLLKSAAVVVAMSEHEAHSVGVLEALHLGRPVVVADATGLHEVVEAGLARGVDPAADSRELARAIVAQLDHPFVPDVGFPTWEACCDRLLEIYGRAIRSASHA
jgi:glycosyltransferase involved in cell wall biosynthesis